MFTPQLEVSQKQLSNTQACEDDHIQCELKLFIPGLTADSIVLGCIFKAWVHFQSILIMHPDFR